MALLLVTIASGSSALAQANRRWIDPPADLGSSEEPSQPAPSGGNPPAAGAAPEAQPAPKSGGEFRSSVAQPRTAPPALEAGPPAAPGQEATPGEEPPPSARPPAPPVRSAQPERPAAPRAEPAPSFAAEPLDAARDRFAGREEAARDLLIDYLDLWSAPNPLALAGSSEFYAPRVIFHGRSMSARALLDEKRRFVQRWPERRYRARPDTIGVACGPEGETCTVRAVFDFTAADPGSGRRSQGIASIELVVASGDDRRPVILAEDSIVHGRGRASASRGLGEADADVP